MKLFIALSLLLSFNIFAQTDVCFVTMDDNLNNHKTTMSVEEVAKNTYQVKDYTQFYDGKPHMVEVKVKEDKVFTDAGTPQDITIEHLKSYYKLENDSQLTWKVQSKSCGELETSLVYFLVMEWFYFG